jgi:hypothetical protein
MSKINDYIWKAAEEIPKDTNMMKDLLVYDDYSQQYFICFYTKGKLYDSESGEEIKEPIYYFEIPEIPYRFSELPHWINVNNGSGYCSKCGKKANTTNYCGNCGRKMF